MRKIYLTIIQTFLIFQICNAQNAETSALNLELPSRVNAYRVSAIGDNFIEVYSNKDNSKFFYQPIIKVDWIDFKKRLDILDKESSKQHKIPIRIHLTDINVENEILYLLNRDNYNVKNVSPLPYSFFEITATIKDRIELINKSQIPTLNSRVNIQVKTSMPSPQRFNITGTYEELQYFYENRFLQNTLKGLLFAQGDIFSSDYIDCLANFSNSTSITKELFGDEKNIKKNIVTSKTKSSGFGINLVGLKFGSNKGKTRVGSEKINKRIVNRNYISNLIYKFKTEISCNVFGDKERTSEIEEKFLTTLLSNFKKVELEFQKINENEYQLISNQIAYANIGGLQLKEILKSKPDIGFSADDSQEVKNGKNSANSKAKGDVYYRDNIAWEFDGKDWIPSKVDMYIVSNSDLTKNTKLSSLSYNTEGKVAMAVEFLFPADWQYSNTDKPSLIDKDNPIGSILPFAGNKENIPVGWMLCKGDFLPINDNEALFNVIGYRWGKNENNEFALPNLQGQFLRGVDYSKKNDPDVDKRKNANGEIGEVGSYQKDGIAKHTHKMNFHQQRDDDGNGGAANDMTVAGSSYSKDTSPNYDYSSETRPKNAYVNFIIRIK